MPTSVGASLRRGCNSLPRDPLLTCPAESTPIATMKRLLARPVFALAIPLSAAAATHPAVYQDGVLTKVRTTVVGNSCSSSIQSDAATYGNTARRTFDASARCSDIHGAVYTVQIGDTEYELTPDHSRAARASAYLPLSATFLKQSSLANHQPGTAVKLRVDDDGFLVLVGKRETHYRSFAAH
jgi:hypothetical protein